MKNKKLLLIDSHALIHRSYHALPPLTGPKGEPTNAIYGFTSILIKALRELKPDYVLAAFDLPEPTFRHLEFEAYKAHRPKTPEDLSSQFDGVKEILAAFEIPVYEKAGFEADDIIGTIANKVGNQKLGVKSIILTGDLDTLQLVDDFTSVYTLKKGLTDTVIYDEKAVSERFNGLKPSQMSDYKGLKGDPSDNIPGVAGIGEKTAISLLKEFGSLENLFGKLDKNPEAVKASIAKKLLENKESAFFSKALATIKIDVDIDFDLKKCELGEMDIEKIKEIFKKFGFMSLMSRIGESGNKINGENKDFDSDISNVKKNFKIKEIKSEKDFDEFLNLAEKEKKIAFNLTEDRIYFALPAGVFNLLKSDFNRLKIIFENSDILKICFDLKKQIKILADWGFEIFAPCFDLMIAAYLLNAGKKSYELKNIYLEYFGELKENFSDEEFISALIELYPPVSVKIKEMGLEKVLNEIEMPLVPVLAEMENNGVKIDIKKIKEISDNVAEKIISLENEIYGFAGEKFNINSPQQISKIIFEKLKIAGPKLRKTPKGVISTQASELAKLKGEHKIIDLILEYRELAKIKSTYLDVLPGLADKNDRLHTTFNQIGTATGRLSSNEPNIQNIPIRGDLGRGIRKCFVAEKGYKLVSFDYSQIELRIVATLADDKKMLGFFKEGKDIHTATAAEINNIKESEVTGELRREAKILNFGILYGMSMQSFAQSAGIGIETAKNFFKEYFSDFEGIKNFIDNTKFEAKKNGFVSTLTGRKRFLPEINSSNWQIRQSAERMAVNMPVQGLAADIIKLAMIKIYEEIKKGEIGAKILLQVHDELVFEILENNADENFKKIKKIMSEVFELKIPLDVDAEIGDSWGALE